LTFSFGPDGRYPTLSEFYHRGIRAPPCTASIGTWTDGRRSEDHSRHEFRCDVSDIDLALVKAMRLYRMIYIYICISVPEGILASVQLSTISSDLASPWFSYKKCWEQKLVTFWAIGRDPEIFTRCQAHTQNENTKIVPLSQLSARIDPFKKSRLMLDYTRKPNCKIHSSIYQLWTKLN